MAFYDLPKERRAELAGIIARDIQAECGSFHFIKTVEYFSDPDSYVRKSAYLSVGRIYAGNKALRQPIIRMLDSFFLNEDFKIRQTVINAAGEIGKTDLRRSGISLTRALSTPTIHPVTQSSVR